MKEQLVELLIKIGLFFANCDGNYDPREMKFIHNFLRNLELNHILVPGDYDKEALEDVAPGNIDSVIADMKSFVNKLHQRQKKLSEEISNIACNDIYFIPMHRSIFSSNIIIL